MALKELFETFDGTGFVINSTVFWRAQTFTTTSAYAITGVALYGWRFGSPGNITVSIRETTDGKPSGDDKASVTVSDSVISVLPTLAWYTFTFASPYALNDTTQYAIVVRAAGADGGNYYAPFGYGSAGYAAGGNVASGNSGSTWGAVNTNNDMNFRVYGSDAPGKAQNPTPTDDQEDIKITGKDQLKILQWEAPA
jgi:hypothetical protein